MVQAHLLELEHHAEHAAVGGAVLPGPGDIRAPGLAHRHKVGSAPGLPVQLVQELHQPGAVGGDLAVGVLGDLVDDVQPEPLDPLGHPGADHGVQLLADGGVLPVQVGLLGSELMEVVLAQLGHIGPSRPPKGGAHLIGKDAGLAVPPDVIIVAGVIPALAGLQKPAVLVAGVVEHQIQQDADAPGPRLPDEGAHILHGAEHGIDGPVVGHIVAVVHLGRGEHRADPQSVHPQLLQVVQPGQDARQVTDAVPVGILKALGIDLVDDGFLPPVLLAEIDHKNAPY